MPRARVEEATGLMLELFPEGFAEEAEPTAGKVALVAFTDEAGARRAREHFAAVETVPVADGWQEAWKRFHVPAVVGPLWIGPPWEMPPDGLVPLVIDPGRAFGTGAHETTRLCLALLLDREQASVLDVGCGSGVLSIAAAKLGFGPVTAIDSDAAAVEATLANAKRNGVGLDVLQADVRTAPLPAADIVLANLDLTTVNALGPRLDCRFVVASGYSRSEQSSLGGFRHLDRRCLGEWAADLHLRE